MSSLTRKRHADVKKRKLAQRQRTNPYTGAIVLPTNYNTFSMPGDPDIRRGQKAARRNAQREYKAFRQGKTWVVQKIYDPDKEVYIKILKPIQRAVGV